MANMNWIKDFSAPEPSTLLSRKALISFAILKKIKLNKTKRAFLGRGGWNPLSPSPSQPMGASALYTSAE